MKTAINNYVKFFVIIFFLEILSFGCIELIDKIARIGFYPRNLLIEYQIDSIRKVIDDSNNYHKFDSLLGWSIKSNASTIDKASNEKGARGNRNYSTIKEKEKNRIESYGDSYTFCDEVLDNETWQYYIEKRDSTYEVINWGVGAYGLDQAYLRYQKTKSYYNSDIVLIGYMTENIARNVNTFRPFYGPSSGTALTKPRYVIRNDSLLLIPNFMNTSEQYNSLLINTELTLQVLGEHDYFYNKKYNSTKLLDNFSIVKLYKIFVHQIKLRLYPDVIIKNGWYNAESEAYRVTIQLFDEFYNDVKNSGQRPIIIVFPHYKDFRRHINNKKKQYQPLIDYFDENKYEYIDLIHALEGYKEKELFSGHYSPKANKLIAEIIYLYINNNATITSG